MKAPTVILSAPQPAAIFLILASPKARDAVAKRVDAIASGVGIAARPAGPDKWLLIADADDAAEALRTADLGPDASSLDQSDGRFLIAAEGPDVRERLAKGTGMDLDPVSFPQGASAMTAFGHVTVHLTHVSPDRYDLVTMSSFAGSLWESLREASLEFGCDAPEELPGLI
jgi:sarcosine oxidase subunit gamma